MAQLGRGLWQWGMRGILLTPYSALRGPSAHDALEKLTQSEKRAQKVLGDNKAMLIARAQQKKPPRRTAFQSGTWKGFSLPPPPTISPNSEHRSEIPQFAFFSIRLSESWVFRDLTG